MTVSGILNLNKPAGWTSRDAVNKVQRLVERKTKIGHAGTLDPLARGVLVVPLGPATRLIEYVQKMPKTYRAEFRLGCTSNTEDSEGTVVELESPPVPGEGDIRNALPRFVGKILQRPPAYSALKVAGRRAYALARQGKAVELAPREIVVYRLELDDYAYPRIGLTIECGSGTYVRSLGRDLAESLGTGAVMTGLERTAIGPFRVEEALDPNDLNQDNLSAALLPAAMAVSHLPTIILDDEAVRRIQNGLAIRRPPEIDPRTETVAVDRGGRLIGILTGRGARDLKTKRNFPTQ